MNIMKSTVVFAAGALVGAAAVLLLTTPAGKQLREQIKDMVTEETPSESNEPTKEE